MKIKGVKSPLKYKLPYYFGNDNQEIEADTSSFYRQIEEKFWSFFLNREKEYQTMLIIFHKDKNTVSFSPNTAGKDELQTRVHEFDKHNSIIIGLIDLACLPEEQLDKKVTLEGLLSNRATASAEPSKVLSLSH